MSSKTIRCQSKTLKGKKCRRNATKGEVYCFQHQEKKEKIEQSCIVHIEPTSELVPIVFNDNGVSDSCCKFKNKYGEFICNEEIKDEHFCDKHFEISFNMNDKFKKIISKWVLTRTSNTTIDTVMNIFYGLFNYVFKHRELIVCLSANQRFMNLTNVIVEKIIIFRNTFMSNKPLASNIKIHKKSLSREYHLNKVSELLLKSNEIVISKQIDKARTSLVANNIKINKLSEIHLRTQPNSNDIRSVISKGIDKKILSFF